MGIKASGANISNCGAGIVALDGGIINADGANLSGCGIGVILNCFNPIFSLLPTESIVRDYQEEYYKAIEDSTELGESTPFIEFMLEMILKSMQNIKDNDVPINVPKNDPIKRLDKIIEIIGENRDITIYELANKLNVADKTIKRDIAKLKEQNRVIRVGSLKSGHWEIKK